jgi:non-heme chloroperoxidase
MFEYQFIELPKHGYRCIGIDLQGFGDSDKPWDGYNYDTMADDVKVVLDTLNIENATLVGFSMGGAISIHYMARHNGAHIKKTCSSSSGCTLLYQTTRLSTWSR